MMKRAIIKLSNQLFEPNREFSRGELLFYKLFELFILSYVIKLSWEWAFYTGRNSEVILPLGLANYIDVALFFGNSLPLIFASAITILSLLSWFRIGFRWQHLLLLFLFHMLYAARYSQGEIPHSANLIGMTLLCFGLGIYFFSEPRKRWRFTFGSMIFFIGLGYTMAAFSKLIGTGPTWIAGEHLWLWIAEKGTDILSREGAFSPNWLQLIALQHVGIATVILLFGWLTELIGVLMWSNRWRPWVVTAIIGMHLGITLTMNIRFDAFVLQLLLIGYPWYRILDKLPTFDSRRFIQAPAWVRVLERMG